MALRAVPRQLAGRQKIARAKDRASKVEAGDRRRDSPPWGAAKIARRVQDH